MKPQRNKFALAALLLLTGFFIYAGPVTGNQDDKNSAADVYYGPVEPVVWTKPVMAVDFSHKTHVLESGLACASCHPGLFGFEAGAAQENPDFNHESFDAGKYCGACHTGVVAFATDTRCTACHIGVKGYERLTGGEK